MIPTPNGLAIRQLIGASIIILGTIFVPSRMHGYTLNDTNWASGSNIVVQLSLGNAPRTLLDGNTSWNAAVAPAAEMWNQKMGHVRFSTVMNSTAAAWSGDRVNSVLFSSSVFGKSFGTGVLAFTLYIVQGTTVEADVVFNTAAVFDSYGGNLRFGSTGALITDIRRVFLHELGHALGLGHSVGDTVMNALISDREVLSPDDIAGVQALYGPPAIKRSSKADFNADGFADLISQNTRTGERSIWLLRNGGYQAAIALQAVPTEWKIASAADFNGDGHADLAWHNLRTGARSIWFLRNGLKQSTTNLATTAIEWQIAGAGDFDNDGYADLVNQNTKTGARAIWFLRNGVLQRTLAVPSVATGWQIAAVADCNADGYSDLGWQNVRTGESTIWFLRSGVMIGTSVLPKVGLEWRLAGAADYNADGHGDVIWQNLTNGQRTIWFLRGGKYQSSKSLGVMTPEWDMPVH